MCFPYRVRYRRIGFAIDGYMASVLLYDGFREEKADTVALDIVDITGGYAVEFFEDMALLLGSDADAIVTDR